MNIYFRKWADFVSEYPHAGCVRGMSLKKFTKSYQKWCKGNRYQFRERKAAEIYAFAQSVSVLVPMPNQSGDMNRRRNKTSKRGSPYLRKALFNVMSIHNTEIVERGTGLPVSGQETIRRETLLRLHDSRSKQVSAPFSTHWKGKGRRSHGNQFCKKSEKEI